MIKRSRIKAGLICSALIFNLVFTPVTIITDSIDKVSASDDTFETSLSEQNFPESYKTYLRALHQTYPNWNFYSIQTGLDWDTVISNESVLGRNLVPISSIDSWKSLESGAYDFNTGSYIGLDGASWVAASTEAVQYFMDPRNALDETSIFQFASLRYEDYQNTAGISNILAGTFMSGNYTDTDGVTRSYADTFLEAGRNAGVSPYYLASRVVQEVSKSGGGYSDSVSGTVAGYTNLFNFFNIGAYTTSTASAVTNGLIYASRINSTYMLPWNSRYKSIMGGALYTGNLYVNKEQYTLYLQKFDVTDGGNGYYYHQYMTNVQAPNSEAAKLKKAHPDYATASLSFYIPVYNNMPDTACERPTGTGYPETILKNLSVSGYNLTPAFSRYNNNYELSVDNSVSSVNISASAYAGSSSISGTGNIALEEGENIVNVVVSSTKGTTRTYTIKINRAAQGEPPVIDPPVEEPVESDVITDYNLSDIITGILPGTTVDELIAGITVAEGMEVSVKKTDNSPKEGIAGTGNVVVISNEDGIVYEYPIVVYGDVTGDGLINVSDLLLTQKNILELASTTSYYKEAMDTNRDGIVSLIDLIEIQKEILDIEQIIQ